MASFVFVPSSSFPVCIARPTALSKSLSNLLGPLKWYTWRTLQKYSLQLTEHRQIVSSLAGLLSLNSRTEPIHAHLALADATKCKPSDPSLDHPAEQENIDTRLQALPAINPSFRYWAA
jgi:hypothetical protein